MGGALNGSQKLREYVLIAGSRNFPKPALVREWIDSRMGISPKTAIIISGAARGVDSVAVAWAKMRGYETKEFPADWNKFGKSAGFRRNAVMVDIADRIFVFWDGKSKGTYHTMELAWEKKKPLTVIMSSGEVADFTHLEG